MLAKKLLVRILADGDQHPKNVTNMSFTVVLAHIIGTIITLVLIIM